MIDGTLPMIIKMESGGEDNRIKTEVVLNWDADISQCLEAFRCLLRGAGYEFKGELIITGDE
jgi:hypothetical protein